MVVSDELHAYVRPDGLVVTNVGQKKIASSKIHPSPVFSPNSPSTLLLPFLRAPPVWS